MLFMRTYRLETVLVHTHFHVEVLEVLIGGLLSLRSRLLVDTGPPGSVHLLILLLSLRILVEVVWRPLLLLGHLLHLHVLCVGLDGS